MVHLQDIQIFAQSKPETLIIGLAQSPVNLAVFMSHMRKTQASGRARHLKQ